MPPPNAENAPTLAMRAKTWLLKVTDMFFLVKAYSLPHTQEKEQRFLELNFFIKKYLLVHFQPHKNCKIIQQLLKGHVSVWE
jgi:hypothetical protein